MTENQFDEFFRDKLQQHASQVPGDMWQRITEKKDKDRKIFFIPRWYFISTILLLIAISGTVYFMHIQPKNNSTEIDEQTTGLKKNTSGNNNNTMPRNIDTANVSTKNNTEGIINKSDDANVTNVIAELVQKDKNSSAKNINQAKQNNNKLKNTSSNFLQEGELPNNNNAITNDAKKEEKIKNTDSIISNQQQNNSIAKQQILLSADSLNNNTEEDVADSLPDQKNHLSLEAYLSPDIPFGKINSSNAAYANERNNASKMKLSYTFGARLSGPIGKHYLWKIGFQYAVINETYNSLDSAATLGLAIHNHYKSLDVPLLLGYKTGNNHFTFSLATGILLNVTSKYSGKILSGFYNDINTSNAYKSNTGISLYLGTSMSTALYNKMELFAEPHFKYRLNNIAQTQQPFSQKIHTLGLSLGVRYNLFKKKLGN